MQSRRNTKCSSHSCSCQGWTICKVTGFVEAVTQQRVPSCRWRPLLHTHVASNSCWWEACFVSSKTGSQAVSSLSLLQAMRYLQACMSLCPELKICPVPGSGTAEDHERWSESIVPGPQVGVGKWGQSQKPDVRRWGADSGTCQDCSPFSLLFIFTTFLPFEWAGNGRICLSYSELSAALRFNFHII